MVNPFQVKEVVEGRVEPLVQVQEVVVVPEVGALLVSQKIQEVLLLVRALALELIPKVVLVLAMPQVRSLVPPEIQEVLLLVRALALELIPKA